MEHNQNFRTKSIWKGMEKLDRVRVSFKRESTAVWRVGEDAFTASY